MSRGRSLRPWGAHALTAAALAVVTAAGCGGSSDSTSGGGKGGSAGKGGSGAGKGGSSTGGSSAAGKGGASGGSSAMGGSGGSGGSSGRGVTGGSAGRGGTSGSGGSSGSGGPGGEGGGGGSSAMTGYHPPDAQVDGCTTLCEREAEADCENETTTEKCVEDCRIGILFEECSEQWDALFECAADAEVECNSSGEATFVGCNGQATATYACVLGDGLDPAFTEPCSDYCAASTATECDNTPAASDCTSTCVIIASAFPVCDPDFSDFIECAADAEYTCNAGGEPEAPECAGEYLLFLGCILTEYDIQP
jgi:hypothetical protein